MFNKNFVRALNKLALIFICVSILYLPITQPTIARSDLNKYPIKEVEFLKINNIKGNILTVFGLGSYVSYKLYPDNLIYMDGRYEEVYNNEEFNNLKYYETVAENWDNILKDYPTQILMPVLGSKIYNHLKESKTWTEVYKGNVTGVFLPKDKVKYNKKFIEPTNNINYYRNNEFENNGQFGVSKYANKQN